MTKDLKWLSSELFKEKILLVKDSLEEPDQSYYAGANNTLDFVIELLVEVEKSNSVCHGVLNSRVKQNREAMEAALEEIKHALYSSKPNDVKKLYLKNAERFLSESLDDY